MKLDRLILKKIIKIVATMSDFKAKMHQIRFRLGLRPRPSKGREGKGEWKGKEGRGSIRGAYVRGGVAYTISRVLTESVHSLLESSTRGGEGKGREGGVEPVEGRLKGWKERGKDPLVLAYIPPDMKS